MPRPVYARIAELRVLLLDDTAFPDAALLTLLEFASELVEHLTGQFFGPKFIDTTVDGLGKRAIQEVERNKVIEVVRLEFRRSDGSFRVIEPRYYGITETERRIRLRTILKNPLASDRAFLAGSSVLGLTAGRHISAGAPARRFPFDDQNIHMQGYFGWLDLVDKHETVLSQDLARGGTQVFLADTDDLLQNDLLLIDRKFWVIVGTLTTASIPEVPEDPGPPIVPAVPAVVGEVTIDPSPGKALTGAEVIRFGQVPLLIRNATIRTAFANQFAPGSEEEGELGRAGFIKKEETDNYEIEFFSRNRAASPETGTGDARADAILSRFRAPTPSGEWA